MLRNANSFNAPNLEAFSRETPKTKIGMVRMLWPTIRLCLEAGHSLREVRSRLQLDGISIPYSTLCWAVSVLRQSAGAETPRAHNTTAAAKPDKAMSPENAIAVDPLHNLKRLSEQRPGFHYTGALPDDELFGSK